MSNFDPHQQTVRSAVARLRVVRLAIPEILRTNPLEPEDNRLARLGEVEQGLAKVAMPRPPQRLAKYPGYSSSVPWHRSR